MSDLTIKYTIVKEADVAKAMESCAKVSTGERKNKKLDGSVWETTVCTVMESLNYNEYSCDTSKEGIDAIRKVLFTIMEKAIYENTTVPETGTDRSGKTITLLNEKTSTIKWSSWDKTRRIFSYLGDVAKVLANDKADLLYPETNKIAARCDILAECKLNAPPLEHIKRLSGQIAGYLPKLEATDAVAAMTELSTLVVPGVPSDLAASSLIGLLDTVISSANADDMEAIKVALFAMATRHYA